MIYLKRIIQEIKLYEGLDITHSQATTINMLKTWGRHERNDSKIGIYPMKEDKNKIFLSIKSSSKSEYDNLLTLINNLGWFPSLYYIHNQHKAYNYEEVIKSIELNYFIDVILEAKFDIQVDEDDMDSVNDLYHASFTKNEKKILKIGLAPRSKEKLMSHPARVYLAFDFKDAEYLAKQPKFRGEEKEMTIFRIDMEGLNKRRLIRFFRDPNFEGGIYTYENIPPQFISVEKRIVV